MFKRLDLEKRKNKHFNILSVQGLTQKNFQGSDTKYWNKNGPRGVRESMLIRETFENLHIAIVILVLFEQFFSKFFKIFCPRF